MEVGAQIKKYRNKLQLSQEELAEKIFVTRQTISNWETGKSYPDIHSLILLGTLYDVSLDQLVKGDIEKMKEEIRKEDIDKFQFYAKIYTVLFVLTLVSAAPLFAWLGYYAFIPWGVLAGVMLFFSLKVEKLKKENNVQTYKEIISFCEGKRLDEMEQAKEQAKRPYQKTLLAIGSAVLAFAVCTVLGLLMNFLLK